MRNEDGSCVMRTTCALLEQKGSRCVVPPGHRGGHRSRALVGVGPVGCPVARLKKAQYHEVLEYPVHVDQEGRGPDTASTEFDGKSSGGCCASRTAGS